MVTHGLYLAVWIESDRNEYECHTVQLPVAWPSAHATQQDGASFCGLTETNAQGASTPTPSACLPACSTQAERNMTGQATGKSGGARKHVCITGTNEGPLSLSVGIPDARLEIIQTWANSMADVWL